jgi:hypothetical protein
MYTPILEEPLLQPLKVLGLNFGLDFGFLLVVGFFGVFEDVDEVFALRGVSVWLGT